MFYFSSMVLRKNKKIIEMKKRLCLFFSLMVF